MKSNSTAILIKIKLRHSLGRPSRSDFVQSQFNVRLIVYINDENIPYFLCAFNERSGKNRTNYSTYTTVMKERINYFLGDDNYE